MGLAFWRKPTPQEPKQFSEKLANRVAKIPTPDLMMWVEQALNETSRACSVHIKSGSKDDIEDMLIGAEAIHCLVNELRTRFMV